MNINFTNTSIGMPAQGMSRPENISASAKTTDATATESSSSFRITEAQTEGLQESEPVSDIPASALVRDDDLGKFVNSIFNLPPPPMPNFAF